MTKETARWFLEDAIIREEKPVTYMQESADRLLKEIENCAGKYLLSFREMCEVIGSLAQ